MFMASTSIGITPAVWATSTTSSTSRSRHARPISASGCTAPMTFEPWLTMTAFVFGRMAFAMSPGSMRQSPPQGRYSRSTPPSRARWFSGRITELCSRTVEIT
jgi:hypothetical protein